MTHARRSRRSHLDALGAAQPRLRRRYPGDRARAPAGAHRLRRRPAYKAETTRGSASSRSQHGAYARDAVEFARRGLRPRRRSSADGAGAAPRTTPTAALRRADPDAGSPRPCTSACARKLAREPVEDFRIDFEDGFGARPDAEEDATAVAAAARGGARHARRARCRRSSASASSPSAKSGRRAARARSSSSSTRCSRATGGRAARQLRGHAAQGHRRRAAARRWCACSSCLERRHGLPAGALRSS